MTRTRAHAWTEMAFSIAWFAMDGAWLLQAQLACLVLAAVTIVLGIGVLFFRRRTSSGWTVDGAMACWACMNVSWMLQNLGGYGWATDVAKLFLAAGAVLLVTALLTQRSEELRTRFRRVRFEP